MVTNFKIEIDPLFPDDDRSNMFQAVVNLSLAGSTLVVSNSVYLLRKMSLTLYKNPTVICSAK